MRNKRRFIRKAVIFITLASAIIACILAASRNITEYAECW